jgi:hypothetical protein
MGQTEDLKTAVAQVGVDLGEAVTRVEAKIAELGEVDADFSPEIEALRNASTSLDGLVADTETPPEG